MEFRRGRPGRLSGPAAVTFDDVAAAFIRDDRVRAEDSDRADSAEAFGPELARIDSVLVVLICKSCRRWAVPADAGAIAGWLAF
jgi:hypothetical protein